MLPSKKCPKALLVTIILLGVSYSLAQEQPNGPYRDIRKQTSLVLDNIMVFSARYNALGMMPDIYINILDTCEQIQPGGYLKTHDIEVSDTVEGLKIICNWDSLENRMIKLRVYSPYGGVFFEKETNDPAIQVPEISGPMSGIWKAEVKATGTDSETCYIAVVAGVTYQPLVDCYVDAKDISLSRESPKLGDIFYIFSDIHAGDKYNKSVGHVLV